MATFAPDPWTAALTARKNRGPNVVSTTTEAAPLPGGGLTLDALMQRAKEKAQPQMFNEIRSPWQGVANMAQAGLQGFFKGQAEGEAAEAQGLVASALDEFYRTGKLSPEGSQHLAQFDPNLLMKMWEQEHEGKWVNIDKPGAAPGTQWQRHSETGEEREVGGGGMTIDAGTKAETTWQSENAKAQSKFFNDQWAAGTEAAAKLADIGQLEMLINDPNMPTGLHAQAVKYLQDNWGISIGEGASKVAAFTALANRLAPQQRPPGSGPMSDRDVNLFLASLPQLMNQKGGNQLIIAGLRGMTQWNAEVGRIASEALRQGDPNAARLWYDQQIAELQKRLDPLKEVRELMGQGGNDDDGGGGNDDEPPQLLP